jgi:hypothetical protein
MHTPPPHGRENVFQAGMIGSARLAGLLAFFPVEVVDCDTPARAVIN